MSSAAKKKQPRPPASKASRYGRFSIKQSNQIKPDATLILEDMHNVISFILSPHSVTPFETRLVQESRFDPAQAGRQPHTLAVALVLPNTSCAPQHPLVPTSQITEERDGSTVRSTTSASLQGVLARYPNARSLWSSS